MLSNKYFATVLWKMEILRQYSVVIGARKGVRKENIYKKTHTHTIYLIKVVTNK